MYQRMIPGLLARHRAYYDSQRSTLRRYRDLYEVAFWKGIEGAAAPAEAVEVADANSWIEGFVASLFSKAPAVRVGGSIRPGDGKDSVAEAVLNSFLYDQQSVFTNGTRASLIFPSAFFKLSVDAGLVDIDPIGSIGLEFLLPWEVIVDEKARSTDAQRWIAHVAQITVASARERWGALKWRPSEAVEFLSESGDARQRQGTDDAAQAGEDDGHQLVEIVEFYDLVRGKLVLYSPSLQREDKILSVADIPLKDWRGRPLPPIVPYYLNSSPDAPLRGFSAIRKIYDPIREKNLLRSKMAEIVRRDVNQLGFDKSAIDEDQVSRIITEGESALIPFNAGATASSVWLLPRTPMSSNYGAYLSYLEQDIQRSSPTAPFTRGEATKATATEVNAMQQYTSAEIGKMARVRDEAIERVATVYLSMLAALLDEDQTVGVLTVRGEPVVVKSADLTGRFKVAAVDQLATPIAQATRKAEILQLFPALVQLGVPAQEVLRQLGDAFELQWVKELADKAPEPPPTAPVPAPVPAPAGAPVPEGGV